MTRLKPLLPHEKTRTPPAIICLPDGRSVELAMPNAEAKRFTFETAFPPDISQERFFQEAGVPGLIESALDGYAATVFAFGQTGAGKTYTMAGTAGATSKEAVKARAATPEAERESSPGLVHMTARWLYHRIEALPETKFAVRVTYLEIYNEQIADLISPSPSPLAVRWSSGGFYVEDLSVVKCRGLKDLLYVIDKGLENRHVRSHRMNSESSRSHAILTIYVDSEPADGGSPSSADGGGAQGTPAKGAAAPRKRYGKISLLDLAGSENLRSSGSDGAGAREAGAINRSLFVLGQCIKALSYGQGPAALAATGGSASGSRAPPQSPRQHAPIRDSVLTKLLADSLGGTSHSLMVACCSQLGVSANETNRVLTYASQAMGIRAKPVNVQTAPREQVINQLRLEVDELRREVQMLRRSFLAPGLSGLGDSSSGLSGLGDSGSGLLAGLGDSGAGYAGLNEGPPLLSSRTPRSFSAASIVAGARTDEPLRSLSFGRNLSNGVAAADKLVLSLPPSRRASVGASASAHELARIAAIGDGLAAAKPRSFEADEAAAEAAVAPTLARAAARVHTPPSPSKRAAVAVSGARTAAPLQLRTEPVAAEPTSRLNSFAAAAAAARALPPTAAPSAARRTFDSRGAVQKYAADGKPSPAQSPTPAAGARAPALAAGGATGVAGARVAGRAGAPPIVCISLAAPMPTPSQPAARPPIAHMDDLEPRVNVLAELRTHRPAATPFEYSASASAARGLTDLRPRARSPPPAAKPLPPLPSPAMPAAWAPDAPLPLSASGGGADPTNAAIARMRARTAAAAAAASAAESAAAEAEATAAALRSAAARAFAAGVAHFDEAADATELACTPLAFEEARQLRLADVEPSSYPTRRKSTLQSPTAHGGLSSPPPILSPRASASMERGFDAAQLAAVSGPVRVAHLNLASAVQRDATQRGAAQRGAKSATAARAAHGATHEERVPDGALRGAPSARAAQRIHTARARARAVAHLCSHVASDPTDPTANPRDFPPSRRLASVPRAHASDTTAPSRLGSASAGRAATRRATGPRASRRHRAAPRLGGFVRHRVCLRDARGLLPGFAEPDLHGLAARLVSGLAARTVRAGARVRIAGLRLVARRPARRPTTLEAHPRPRPPSRVSRAQPTLWSQMDEQTAANALVEQARMPSSAASIDATTSSDSGSARESRYRDRTPRSPTGGGESDVERGSFDGIDQHADDGDVSPIALSNYPEIEEWNHRLPLDPLRGGQRLSVGRK